MPEPGLIALIKGGDREAFNSLCRNRYASLISYARLVLSGLESSWAEDVVQDVLFGVWQNRLRLIEDNTELQSYLLRSVYNRCLNYIKKAKRAHIFSSYYEENLASILGDCWSPERNPVIASVFGADIRDMIEESIRQLPPRCREVFTLSYLDNLSNREISEKLGISVSTVENHMYLALKQLRKNLAGV